METNLIAKRLKNVARLFIVAIALCAFARSPAIAEQTMVEVERLPDFFDEVNGSCREFDRAISRGVHQINSPMSRIHENACGYTDIIIPDWTYTYDPRVTKDKGSFCARVSGSNLRFKLRPKVSVSMLKWLHGKEPESECAKEWQRLENLIRVHEEKHASSAQPVLDAAVAKLRKMDFAYCTTPQEGATDAKKAATDGLERNISDEWSKTILTDLKKRRDEIDNAGDVCKIDCSKCIGPFKLGYRDYFEVLNSRFSIDKLNALNIDFGITGNICSIDSEFKAQASKRDPTQGIFTFNKGTWRFTGTSKYIGSVTGSGSYWFEGLDSDEPWLILEGSWPSIPDGVLFQRIYFTPEGIHPLDITRIPLVPLAGPCF